MSMAASPISFKTTFFVDQNGRLACHVGSSAQTIINHKKSILSKEKELFCVVVEGMCEKPRVFDMLISPAGACRPENMKKRETFHTFSANFSKSIVFLTCFWPPSLARLRVAPETYQKHETFREFGPRCEKSLVFLTLPGGQAGLGAPRVRKQSPAGARKTSKTRDFSHIPARKCQKHYTFHTFGPRCVKSLVFLTPRGGNVRKVSCF